MPLKELSGVHHVWDCVLFSDRVMVTLVRDTGDSICLPEIFVYDPQDIGQHCS